jgi:peptidoglycan glycosyltransferase
VNRYIRRVAFGTFFLFLIVFINLNLIQLINAESLASNNANQRLLLKEYSIERGPIVSLDGITLAESKPTPAERLRFLRNYPNFREFAHITGFYSFIFGRGGLELSYNGELTGRGGVLTMQDLQDSLLEGGRKGHSVFITVDSRVQKAAVDALGDKKGAVAAIEPSTGRILALASFPSYDPNLISSHDADAIRTNWASLQQDPNKPMLLRATQEAYPPGSTFKVVTAAAAIEHGVPPETVFPPTSEFQPPQTERKIRNFGNGRCGGDMTEALRVSCNVYFAQVGAQLSGEDFAETARAFGFSDQPPIDIKSARSKFPSEENLKSPAFRAQAAIGQFDVAATPLQMALVAAAVANRGQVLQPVLLDKVLDVRTNAPVDVTQPKIWKEAMSEQTADKLKAMMINVVEKGTGRSAQISGVEVGGKTGTAQAGQEGAAPHAWFIAFAGVGGLPKIAVAAVVENGGDLGNEATGGRLAAPIAKAVIEAYRAAAPEKW